MKLRNKKTGEIKEFDVLGGFMLSDDYPNLYTEDKTYNSLAEFNEEWEDCKETLIKDEKIRKAMKVWARLNNVKEVAFDEYWHSFRDVDMVISFLFTFRDFDCLEDGKRYTIAELCGEEE